MNTLRINKKIIVLLVGLFGALLFWSGDVFAVTPGCPNACGSITATVNVPAGIDPTTVTVRAERKGKTVGDNVYNLSYVGKNTWKSGEIAYTDSVDAQCSNPSASTNPNILFNVGVGGGQIQGAATNIPVCGKESIIAISVRKTGGTATSGSIKGKVTVINPDGKQENCAVDNQVTITDNVSQKIVAGGQDNSVKIKADGTYASGAIPPGNYLVSVYCFQPNNNGGTINKSFNVAQGNPTNGDMSGAVIPDPTVTPYDPANDTTASCDNSAGELAGLTCPIIKGLAAAIDGVYSLLIQPLLKTNPVPLNTNDNNYKVWSTFRIIGDVFLVIALLVIVFGQSIGGGLIDAYSAKKILPRLFAAAILINLSYYIVALAVDVSNIVGGGLQNILMAPFNNNGSGIRVGDGASGIGASAVIAAGVTSIWAVSTGVVTAASATAFLGPMLPFFLLFILLPAILAVIAILAIVIFRQGLITLLLLISPVAFAFYCLPNTEQYFKKWWDLLFKTLLIYPIMAVLFAMSNIFAITITNSGGFGGPLKPLVALFALFVPLFLIPFAFKLAGGVLARLHEVMSTGGKRGLESFKGNPNDPNSIRSKTKFRAQSALVRGRGTTVAGLQAPGRSRLSRRVGKALNYGNLQSMESAHNKHGADLMATQIATGNDQNVRDLLIGWDGGYNNGLNDDGTAKAQGAWVRRMDMDATGKALPGSSAIYTDKDQGQIAHDKSMSVWGKNKSYVQEAMYYEWKKTGYNPDQMANLEGQYGNILRENNFTDEEGGEIMTGVGFKHQGQSLISKHSRYAKDKDSGKWGWKRNYIDFAKESAFNIGTYGFTNQDTRTFTELNKGHELMTETLASDEATTNSANDNHVFTTGNFKGKSIGQVRTARSQIEHTAASVNPVQQQGGGGQQRVGTTGSDEPQFAGGQGIGSAPVEVQAAAFKLYQDVTERNDRRPVSVGPENPTRPEERAQREKQQREYELRQQKQGPAAPAPPRIITPDSDDFNVPPGSLPRS